MVMKLVMIVCGGDILASVEAPVDERMADGHRTGYNEDKTQH